MKIFSAAHFNHFDLPRQACTRMRSLKADISFLYYNPTYMILVVPSNASDNVYCTVIAQSSVYEAMTIPVTQVKLSMDDKIVYLSMLVH